jgi:hypothetical protein
MRDTCELYGQNQCQIDKAQLKPAVTLPETLFIANKVYALSMKIPCRICSTSTLDCDHFEWIRYRARWMVKRAPVSPGRLLALASPA